MKALKQGLVGLLVLVGFISASANAMTGTVGCGSLTNITVTTWTPIASSDITIFVPSDYDMGNRECLRADFNGDGLDDLFVQAENGSDDSVIFYATADGIYREKGQVISPTELGINWDSVNSLVSAEDIDGDGNADLKFDSNTDGGKSAILFASSAGSFDRIGETWVNYSTPTSDENLAMDVGQTPGSFAVSSGGAATYNIPISVPPGRNKLQPNLSIAYNSQGGNGVMGFGWNLAGISAITRCPKTIIHDQIKGGVTLTNEDRFCYNGQRLVLTEGETYGGDSAKYQTEIDSYSAITHSGTAGTGPAEFTIIQTNGTKLHFGNYGTDNNAQFKPGTSETAMMWKIKHIEDPFGNYMAYNYEATEGGAHRIKDIQYTGHDNTSPTRSVVFEYINSRNDKLEQYIAGHKVVTDYRLSRIKTYLYGTTLEGGQLVSNYKIEYRDSDKKLTSQPMLESVTKCAVTKCLSPINVIWTDTSTSFNFSGTNTGFNSYIGGSSEEAPAAIQRVKTGDFNGDGIQDIYYVNGDGGHSTDKVYLGLSSGGFSNPINALNSYVSNNREWRSVEISQIQFGDFNGDGKTDIYQINDPEDDDNTAIIQDKIYLSKGDGTFDTANWHKGLESSINKVTPEAAAVGIGRIKFGDFNGDGKTDIYYVNGWNGREIDTVYLVSYDGTSVTFPEVGISTGVNSQLGVSDNNGPAKAMVDLQRFNFGDFNADGKTDFYYVTDNGYASPPNNESRIFTDSNGTDYIYLSDGHGKFKLTFFGLTESTNRINMSSPQTASTDISRYKFADFNGDGATDIFYMNGGWERPVENKVFLNDGRGKFDESAGISTGITSSFTTDSNGDTDLNWSSSDIGRLKFGEFTGDGILDVYYIEDDGTAGKIYPGLGNGKFGNSQNTISVGLHASDYQAANIGLSRFLLADFSGDGITDIYRVNGWGESIDSGAHEDKLYINNQNKAFVKSFDKIYGTDVDIAYKPISDSSVYTAGSSAEDLVNAYSNFQGPYYVVETAKNSKTGYEASDSTTYFQYYGALIHKEGRGFLGFEKLTKTESLNLVKSTIGFFQQFPFTGLEKYSVLTDVEGTNGTYNGNILTYTNFSDVETRSASRKTWAEGEANKPNTHNLYLSKSVQSTYNNAVQLGKTIVTDIAASDYDYTSGLVKKTIESIKAGSVSVDDYISDDESAHIEAAGGLNEALETISENVLSPYSFKWGTKKRTSKTTISKKLPNSTPETRTTSFNYTYEGALDFESIEPDQAQFTVTKTYGYDVYGNRVSVKTSDHASINNDASTNDYDFIDRTSYVDYTTNGYFPTQTRLPTTNGIIQSESNYFDARFGLKTQLTGPNGITTSWSYDQFGRQIAENRADGTSTTQSIGKCAVGGCVGVRNSVYYQTISSSGATPAYTYYDVYGRELRVETIGLDSARIFTDKVYDSHGRLLGVTKPYFELETPFWGCYRYNKYNALEKEYETNSYPCEMGTLGQMEWYHRVTKWQKSFTETVIYNYFVENDANKTVATIHTKNKNVLGQLTSSLEDSYNIPIPDAKKPAVFYEYDAWGNLIKTELKRQDGTFNAETDTIYTPHNIRGFKTGMTDPDKGTWQYKYDVLGNLIYQKDAEGEAINNMYDTLNRLIQRIEDGEVRNDGTEETSVWVYDTAVNGIGKLAYEHNQTTDFKRTYTYDSYGRPSSTTHQIKDDANDINKTLTTNTTYDSYSRVSTIGYPNVNGTTFTVKNEYNAEGYLENVKNAVTNKVYWTLEGINAAGQITKEKLGEIPSTSRVFDPATGHITNINGWKQDATYVYDTLGNLRSRADNLDPAQEFKDTFKYDWLNRISEATISESYSGWQVTRNYSYDAFGNIESKSGTATVYNPTGADTKATFTNTYLYSKVNAGSHAVTSVVKEQNDQNIGTSSYAYDDNGNMTSSQFAQDNERTLSYTSFSKPREIRKGNTFTKFGYDTSHMRSWQVTDKDTTIYISPRTDTGYHYEQVIENGVTKHRHYIYGGTGMIAVHEETDDATPEKYNYFFKDHIGSIEVVVEAIGDGSASCKGRYKFDEFGKQTRTDCGGTSIFVESFSLTHHGFTGHEHLEDLGVIHMNGRTYDADLGRMMQADPFIQAPGYSQSYNRYSYAWNNPLSMTDPSGYFSLGDVWDAINDNSDIVGAVLIITGVVIICAGSSGVGCSGAISGGAKLYGSIFIASGASTIASGRLTAETGSHSFGGYGNGGSSSVNLFPNIQTEAERDAEFNTTVGMASAANAKLGRAPLKGANTNELPQHRIDRLANEVYVDFEALPRGVKISAYLGVGIDGDINTHGKWITQDEIVIAYESRGDEWIKSVILHELLHVDEANYVAGGSRGWWLAHEYMLDGGHDSWTTNAGNRYYRHLIVPGVNKPNLQNAPWRR